MNVKIALLLLGLVLAAAGTACGSSDQAAQPAQPATTQQRLYTPEPYEPSPPPPVEVEGKISLYDTPGQVRRQLGEPRNIQTSESSYSLTQSECWYYDDSEGSEWQLCFDDDYEDTTAIQICRLFWSRGTCSGLLLKEINRY